MYHLQHSLRPMPACLPIGPSSCLRIGGHRHGQQGSPHASVSYTLNTICNGYSCPFFDIISPASPWSSSTSVSGNGTMQDLCAQIISSDYMAEVLQLPSFDFCQETTSRLQLLYYVQGGPKKVSQCSLHITSLNTVRFSKFFHCHIRLEICNKAVIKYSTSPQTCCHTTL